MPSTYTLNNGIELIATGEQSGTWGDTTNTNLQLLDTALDGQVTFTLTTAGSSGSPTALPIADGVSLNSEGRNRLVIVNDGGDLGATAYVQLTPNDAEKIIYIRNDLSGSRSLILFQGTYSASRDYEVPAGTTAVVYFTGGGSGAAVAANVFNNAYFDSLRLGSVSVTAILDEDDMSSDSATSLATQQSIKAYVDSQVTAQDLDFAGDSGTGAVDLDSETFTVAGTANEIETSASGQTLTVGLPDDVTVATSVTTTTIKTSNIDANDGTAAINIADSTGAVDIDTSLTVDGNTFKVDGSANRVSVGTTTTYAGNDFTVGATSPIIALDDGAGTLLAQFSSVGTTTNDVDLKSLRAGNLTLGTNNTDRLNISSNGDITFYDSLGSNSFVYDESAGITINDQQAARDFTVKSDGKDDMLYVDGTNNRVGIGEGAPSYLFQISESDPVLSLYSNGSNRNTHIYMGDSTDADAGRFSYDIANDQLQIWTNGAKSMTVNSDATTTIINDNAGTGGANLHLFHDTASGASGDYAGDLVFYSNSDAGNKRVISRVRGYVEDATDTGEDGILFFFNRMAGVERESARFTSTVNQFNGANQNVDFKVSSENQANMLFVDAAEDRVGIGTNIPTSKVNICFPSGTNAPTSVTRANAYVHLGHGEYGPSDNGKFMLAFGYTDGTTNTNAPAYIGFEEQTTSGDTYGDLTFYTRNVTTDTAPTKRMTIENTGEITLETNAALHTDSTDTSATTQTAVYSFSATTYTGAKFLVCVTDSTATERYITELLVTHDGTTAVATEYGQVATDTALATFDVDISGGNVRLLATPASSNSMTFKVMSTQLLA